MTERLLQSDLAAKGFTVMGGTDAKYFDPADTVAAPDGNVIYVPKDAACFDEAERQLQNVLSGGGNGVISCTSGRYVFKDYKVVEKPPASWTDQFKESAALYKRNGSAVAVAVVWADLFGPGIKSVPQEDIAEVAKALAKDFPGLELMPDIYYRHYDRLIATISSSPNLLEKLVPSIAAGISNSAIGLAKTEELFTKMQGAVNNNGITDPTVRASLLEKIDDLWPSDEEFD